MTPKDMFRWAGSFELLQCLSAHQRTEINVNVDSFADAVTRMADACSRSDVVCRNVPVLIQTTGWDVSGIDWKKCVKNINDNCTVFKSIKLQFGDWNLVRFPLDETCLSCIAALKKLRDVRWIECMFR